MLSAPRNKAGRPTHLIKHEDSLVVVSAYNEGGHGLPLENHALSYQLQSVLKALNC